MTPNPGPAARPRRGAVVALATAGALALTGCSDFRVADSIPLLGGQGGGGDAYQVDVIFTDVLDLVPEAAVKVDDVTVGAVKEIELDDFLARVTVSINGDVDLPANATARLRQTSLLGEKFVALAPPADSAPGGARLAEDMTIPVQRTGQNPELEDIFSALSLVLSGGGISQLGVINKELAAAFNGREADVRSLFQQLNTFVGTLDDQRADIIRALEGIDRLSQRLNEDKEIIQTALDDIPPGLEVLTDQRANLIAMLQSLDRLGDVSVRVIDGSQDNLVANLRALEPVLDQLGNAGQNFTRQLEILLTYPFGRGAETAIQGDYTNLWVSLEVTQEGLIDFLLSELANNAPEGAPGLPELPVAPLEQPTEEAPPAAPVPAPPTAVPAAPPAAPQPPALPGAPALPGPAPLDLGGLLGLDRAAGPAAASSPAPVPGGTP